MHNETHFSIWTPTIGSLGFYHMVREYSAAAGVVVVLPLSPPFDSVFINIQYSVVVVVFFVRRAGDDDDDKKSHVDRTRPQKFNADVHDSILDQLNPGPMDLAQSGNIPSSSYYCVSDHKDLYILSW